MKIFNETLTTKISFVIPCYNAEEFIEVVIKSIQESCEECCDEYEIIVVDNGSNDKSATLARRCGALVVASSAETVSGVRNDGVKVAQGNLLVFIDADVQLDRSWCSVLFNRLKNAPDSKIVTGSHCVVPETIKEPFFTWYKSIENDDRNTHLGSGHMIMPRNLFDEIGGFDNKLKSGEDYELCQRARKSGALVQSDSNLVARHLGYPDTVWRFVARECWHGASDFSTLYNFLKSKVALFAVFFAFLQISVLFSVFVGSILMLSLLLPLTIVLLAIFVYAKFGFKSIKVFALNICVSYIYLFGRACSLVYPVLEGKK